MFQKSPAKETETRANIKTFLWVASKRRLIKPNHAVSSRAMPYLTVYSRGINQIQTQKQKINPKQAHHKRGGGRSQRAVDPNAHALKKHQNWFCEVSVTLLIFVLHMKIRHLIITLCSVVQSSNGGLLRWLH